MAVSIYIETIAPDEPYYVIGVNLAGVSIILCQSEQVEALRAELTR